MSDSTILAIIGAIGTAFGLFINYKLEKLRIVANKTQAAVNGLSVVKARELVVVTDKLAVADASPANVEVAEDAAKALSKAQQVQDELKK